MATLALPTPSVLLVHDIPDDREVYASTVRASGYRAVTAETSNTAYQIAITAAPDLVVTDVRIAGSLRGLELVRRLRNHSRTTNVRIIVLTSVARPQDGDIALKAGANTVLQKPVPAAVLMEEILRLMTAGRTCPHCLGVLTYRDRWPVLSSGLPASIDPALRERLHYYAGWFCTNLACDYQDVQGNGGEAR